MFVLLANIIGLSFGNTVTFTYDANGGVDSTNGNAWSNDSVSQCNLGDDFILPTPPAKMGYDFDGWRVKALPICELNQLDYCEVVDWDANHCRWKPIDWAQNPQTMEIVLGTENSDDLNPGEWAMRFSYGEVKGEALCSNTAGTHARSGNPSTSNTGVNCWCRTTQYTPNNGTCSAITTDWVFDYKVGYGGAARCAVYCAYGCARDVHGDDEFRRAVLGGLDVCPEPQQCDINEWDYTIQPDEDGAHIRWKPMDGGVNEMTMMDLFGYDNSDDLNPGELAISFDFGTIMGETFCGNNSGNNDFDTTGDPGSEGQYCWYHITQYTPTGGEACSPEHDMWVYIPSQFSSTEECKGQCPFDSAQMFLHNDNFRDILYSVN